MLVAAPGNRPLRFLISVMKLLPLTNVTQTYILDSLGMTASGWSFDAINMEDHSVLYEDTKTPFPLYSLITYPDGGFTTSSSDLAAYLNELIKGFMGKGTLL